MAAVRRSPAGPTARPRRRSIRRAVVRFDREPDRPLRRTHRRRGVAGVGRRTVPDAGGRPPGSVRDHAGRPVVQTRRRKRRRAVGRPHPAIVDRRPRRRPRDVAGVPGRGSQQPVRVGRQQRVVRREFLSWSWGRDDRGAAGAAVGARVRDRERDDQRVEGSRAEGRRIGWVGPRRPGPVPVGRQRPRAAGGPGPADGRVDRPRPSQSVRRGDHRGERPGDRDGVAAAVL